MIVDFNVKLNEKPFLSTEVGVVAATRRLRADTVSNTNLGDLNVELDSLKISDGKSSRRYCVEY